MSKRFLYQVQSSLLLCCLSLSTLTSCTLLKTKETVLEQADRLREQKQFEQAIALYREHLNERLSKGWRPKWENPYFYLLTIGDVYLEANDPIKAQQSYELATTNQVAQELVADRFLSLALWYEQNNDLEKAVRLLELKKELDPLLYNAVIDRLNKQIIVSEQAELEQNSLEDELDDTTLEPANINSP